MQLAKRILPPERRDSRHDLKLLNPSDGMARGRQNETGSRHRGLLETAPDAMAVVNRAGAIVLLNLHAEKQFGSSRDELVELKRTQLPDRGKSGCIAITSRAEVKFLEPLVQ